MKNISFIIMLCILCTSHYSYSQLWQLYSDSAKIFNDQRNTDKTIEFYIKANEELKKDSMWTNSHSKICNILGNLYSNINQNEKAERFYLEVMQITEKVSGKETVDYATSCNILGRFYRIKGQYKKAEPLLLKAKLKREKVLGKESADYAQSCNGLANLYSDMGHYEKAELLYLEAKQIREKVLGKENAEYASTCSNLGIVYTTLGKYEEAESLYLEAKQIRERVLGKENPDYAISCNNLANLYKNTGQYKKAEELHLEALQIREKVFNKKHPDYAQSCHNLATLYKDIGKFENAESLFVEAREIRRNIMGEEHPDYAESCNNLANVYKEIGQYNSAESLYLEAKQIWEKILGKENPRYGTTCNNLAVLYMEIGQYEKAESLYLETKQIREKTLGKNHLDYAQSCTNLAFFYNIRSQYEKAEPLFVEAKQICKKVLGDQHRYYALVCFNLAYLYKNMGEYEKAEPLYLQAKQIRENALGKEHPDYTASCIDLANLYWAEEKLDSVNKLFLEAFTSQNNQIKKIFKFTNEAEKQLYLKKIAEIENYILSFNMAAYSYANGGFSYDVSLSNRNLILSSSQELRNISYNSSDTSIKSKYATWINLREQLSYWYTKPLPEYCNYLKELSEQADIIEKDLTRHSSAFKKTQNNITWKTIQQQLKPDEATIEFVKFHFYNGKRWTDSIYYIALLLTKNSPQPELIFLFEHKQLDKLMKAGNTYRTIAALYKNEAGNAAYNLIWAPIEKRLEGVRKIYFAPAQLLYRISLPAIAINDHETLGDKYQLVQLNGTAFVVEQSEDFINPSDKICLYGGINYDVDSTVLRQVASNYHNRNENMSFYHENVTRGNIWKYLPGTENEIRQIENLGRQKNYYVVSADGDTALEESIKALNGSVSPSVLHVATHGFFFPDPKEKRQGMQNMILTSNIFKQSENPLFRSGLLFAGANNAWRGRQIEGVEDGILTAYEVSNLYLPNAKLAVLSACETGLGDILGNDGVYGLQRAFKIAGVKTLVMSLWKVPDQETTEFMRAFYKNMFDGQPITDAFYNAQNIMKNKYRNEPYKWAAWLLVK